MALTPGATHMLQWALTKGCNTARWSQSQKYALSSDRSLQLDCVKAESLVTAGQLNCGEYVPGVCTHRPSRHLSRLHPKSMAQPAREGVAEGVGGEGDEVVTR
jgi:hypothetical protein